MSALLEVSDVRITFPVAGRIAARLTGGPMKIEAVAGVSFVLEAGKTFALVGESGSGKTTLARAIAGLNPPSGGEILFAGRCVSDQSERALLPIRREIGMIFQDPTGSLSPRLSVRSILAEPFRVHGVRALGCSTRWGCRRALRGATRTSFRAGRRGASASPARSR
jgi:peptide/nickel transport system ATP-binding protein